MPDVPKGVKRIVLLTVSICLAVTATLTATDIIPRADPIYQIAEQTVKSAGIPARAAPGPPQ